MNKRYNIGYEAWQMQCCGEPLEVGEVVTLYLDGREGEDLSSGLHIDYWEEHHNGMTRKITGKVVEIKAVFIDKFNPADSIHNMNNPNNVYSVFDATFVDGYSDLGDYCGRKIMNVCYYVVTLEDALLLQLKDDDL